MVLNIGLVDNCTKMSVFLHKNCEEVCSLTTKPYSVEKTVIFIPQPLQSPD